MPHELNEPYLDSNGVLTEQRWIGGQEVIVHYDDVPETDRTVRDGIPMTTPLRTVIDIAPDIDEAELHRIIGDCLRRRLFTVDEALARVARPDMVSRPGALLLLRALEQRYIR